MVLFDRSWYSRAGVEKVNGFATPDQVSAFYREAPLFEQSLVNAGIKVIKLWLEVSDEEQERRFQARLKRDFKRWKLSPMDLNARSKWVEYSRARDEMVSRRRRAPPLLPPAASATAVTAAAERRRQSPTAW